MRVVGLDLSLTATGYADEHGTATIRVKARGPERLAAIRDELGRRILGLPNPPVLVVLEGYSYGSKGSSVYDIGELGGVMRLLLWEQHTPWAEVAPATLKKFTTGKGNVGKDEMLLAADRRWGFTGANNNEADAFMLRMMGQAHLKVGDFHIRALPAYAAEALERVDWPKVGAPA